jgi:hypothetical protein
VTWLAPSPLDLRWFSWPVLTVESLALADTATGAATSAEVLLAAPGLLVIMACSAAAAGRYAPERRLLGTGHHAGHVVETVFGVLMALSPLGIAGSGGFRGMVAVTAVGVVASWRLPPGRFSWVGAARGDGPVEDQVSVDPHVGPRPRLR